MFFENCAAYKWCTFLGLLPKYNQKTQWQRRKTTALCSILFLHFVASECAKALVLNQGINKYYFLQAILLLSINLHTIRNFSNCRFERLLGNCKKIYQISSRHDKPSNWHFGVVNGVFAAAILADLYSFLNWRYVLFLNENICQYMLFQTVVLAKATLEELVHQSGFLNSILDESLHCTLDVLRKESLQIFNCSFGTSILVFTILSTSNSLSWIRRVLYSDHVNQLTTFLWLLLYWGTFTSLLKTAEELKHKEKRFLAELGKENDGKMLLFHQARDYRVEASAAGFFPLKLSVLFNCLGLMCYLTVFLVQVKYNSHSAK